MYVRRTASTANDDWDIPLGNRFPVDAVGGAPPSILEPATVIALDPGAYTVVVEGGEWPGPATGVATIELFVP